MASIIFVPLRFGWSLLWFKWYRGFIFWCFIIYRFSDLHSSCNAGFTSCASSFNLSPRGKISYIIVLQPFSLHVFVKWIILIAIFSASFFDLKWLVLICRVTLSVFRRSVGLMELSMPPVVAAEKLLSLSCFCFFQYSWEFSAI